MAKNKQTRGIDLVWWEVQASYGENSWMILSSHLNRENALQEARTQAAKRNPDRVRLAEYIEVPPASK